MDDVERMYRHLVRTIRAGYPQYLTQPFEVGDLYQTILPYRLHRRELGLETNSDYEHTLLELLTGANGYLVVDDRMKDVLTAERASGNADAGKVRDFATAHIALAPEALARLDTGASGGSSPAARQSSSTPVRTASPTPNAAIPPVAPKPVPARRETKPLTVPEGGEACPFCKGALPAGREISFCPHCGQDLTVLHCPACGSEIERGWKFCVTCGRGTE